jgi:hypothetical protein
MKKLKKAILVALISSPLLTSNVANAGDYHDHNAEIKSNLTPITESITGYLVKDCDREITFSNYQEVLSERASGVYRNPVGDDCIPLSFNSKEPVAFYQELLDLAEDKVAAKDVIHLMIGSKYSDNLDAINIHKVYLKDGRVAQLARINDGNEFKKIERSWRKRQEVSAKLDEYVFLHELFHLSSMNFDQSIPKSVREGMSDVSAVITISAKHSLTLDQTIDFAREVTYGRRSEARGGNESHYNKEVLGNMLNYFETLREKGLEMKQVSSLDEANSYAQEIALNLDEVKRQDVAGNSLYWEKGMDLKGKRRNFNEILEIARVHVDHQGHDHNHESAKVNKKMEEQDPTLGL